MRRRHEKSRKRVWQMRPKPPCPRPWDPSPTFSDFFFLRAYFSPRLGRPLHRPASICKLAVPLATERRAIFGAHTKFFWSIRTDMDYPAGASRPSASCSTTRRMPLPVRRLPWPSPPLPSTPRSPPTSSPSLSPSFPTSSPPLVTRSPVSRMPPRLLPWPSPRPSTPTPSRVSSTPSATLS